jgi:hypothetical protein
VGSQFSKKRLLANHHTLYQPVCLLGKSSVGVHRCFFLTARIVLTVLTVLTVVAVRIASLFSVIIGFVLLFVLCILCTTTGRGRYYTPFRLGR